MKTRSEKDEWILFKARDRYARDESEKAPFFDLARPRRRRFRSESSRCAPESSELRFPTRRGFSRRSSTDGGSALRKKGDRIQLLTKNGEDISDRGA